MELSDQITPQKGPKKKMSSNTKGLLAIGVVIIVVACIAAASSGNKKTALNDSPAAASKTTIKQKTATTAVPKTTTSSPTSSSTTGPTSPATGGSTTTTSSSCSPVSQATSLEGTSGCIQFTGYAYTSGKGEMYLDQSLSAPYGFSAYIPAGTSFGPSLLTQYNGQSIDVTGSIISYDGEPEITISSPSQIQLAN